MTKSPRKNVPDVGIHLGAACMPSELDSDRATAPGVSYEKWVFALNRKASISLGCDNSRLVGDKVCDKNATFRQFSHWGLTGNCDHDIYATVARKSHDTRTNHWRISVRLRVEFAYMSRDSRAIFARHSYEARTMELR